VRIANTQKSITTTAKNANQQSVRIRQCSEPEAKLKEIYEALNYKQRPFVRRKSVGLKSERENQKKSSFSHFQDG
jgi:acylphosphatase